MSARRFRPNDSESFPPNTLPDDNFLLDDTMAQWTNEVGNDLFSSQAEAACGASANEWVIPNGAFDLPTAQYQLTQDSTFDSLFLPQIDPPQAVAGAQELPLQQVNASSYPENPSLTTGSWVWVPDATPISQYDANPSLFGGINIDPALLALDPPNPFHPTRTPQVPDAQPFLSPAAPEPASSPSCSSPSQKRKQHPTTDDDDSPSPPKRSRASKPAPKNPSLTAPLSILTASSPIPLKDVAAHVKRPIATRRTDAAYTRNRKNQAIPRPSNSFMLYRMAYTERIQAMDRDADNHQVVSSVAGESWRMETVEVRDAFKRLAEVEKVQHEKAWPGYKYQPTK